MSKQTYDVTIKQNRDWFMKLIFMDDRGRFLIDLTGYEAKMSFRNYENEDLIKSISTTEGGITITQTSGMVLCHLTNSETNEMDFQNNLGKYQLVLYKDSVNFEAVKGKVTFEDAIVEDNL
jgi:hypothetical protein